MNYSILFEKQWEIINVKHNKIVRALHHVDERGTRCSPLVFCSSFFFFLFLLTSTLFFVCLLACLPPLLYVSFIWNSWIFRLSLICFYRFSFLTQNKAPAPSSSHSHLPKASNGKFAIQHIDFNICISCSFKQALHIKWRDGVQEEESWWWWK